MNRFQQEVTYRRRALMYLTSTTQNVANDFLEEKTIWWYKVQERQSWKMEGESIAVDEALARWWIIWMTSLEHIGDIEMDY